MTHPAKADEPVPRVPITVQRPLLTKDDDGDWWWVLTPDVLKRFGQRCIDSGDVLGEIAELASRAHQEEPNGSEPSTPTDG